MAASDLQAKYDLIQAEERMLMSSTERAHRTHERLIALEAELQSRTSQCAALEGKISDLYQNQTVDVQSLQPPDSSSKLPPRVRRAASEMFKSLLLEKIAEISAETPNDTEPNSVQGLASSEPIPDRGTVRTVTVNSGDKSSPHATFHIPAGLTFGGLTHEVTNFWGVTSDDFELRDAENGKWPESALVEVSLAASMGVGLSPQFHLVRRVKPKPDLLAGFKHPKPVFTRAVANDLSDDVTPSTIPPHIASLAREATLFVLVVAFFVMGLFFRRNIGAQYDMSSGLRDVIIKRKFGLFQDQSFYTIKTPKDFWDWTNGPLTQSLIVDRSQAGYLRYSNKLVGAMRLRQLRVAPNVGCAITEDLGNWERNKPETVQSLVSYVSACFGPYSEAARSTATYGKGAMYGREGFVFVDKLVPATWSILAPNAGLPLAQQRFDSHTVFGDLALFYGPSGFVKDISTAVNASEFARQLNNLESGGWVDRQTRAVIMGFIVYNPNYNYFATMELLFEFTTSGSVLPKDRMNILRTDRLVGDRTQVAFEVIGFVVAPYFLALTLSTLRKLSSEGALFFRNPFQVIELAIASLYTIGFVLQLSLVGDPVRAAFKGPALLTTHYVDMARLGQLNSLAFGLDGMVVVLCFFRMLKYYALHPRLHFLYLTLYESGPRIIAFLLIFTTFFLGFALMAHTVFGPEVLQYSTFVKSVSTLLLGTVGDLDYNAVARVSLFWAPVLFVGYIIIMKFVLFNSVLAILNHSFASLVARNAERKRRELETGTSKYYILTLTEWLTLVLPFYGKILQSRKMLAKISAAASTASSAAASGAAGAASGARGGRRSGRGGGGALFNRGR